MADTEETNDKHEEENVESGKSDSGKSGAGVTPKPRFSGMSIFMFVLLAVLLGSILFDSFGPQTSEVTWGFFHKQLEDKNIKTIKVQGDQIHGEFNKPPIDPKSLEPKEGETEAKGSEGEDDDADKKEVHLEEKFVTTIPPLAGTEIDTKLRKELGPKYGAEHVSDGIGLLMMISLLVPILLFVAIWVMFRRTRDQVMGGGMFSAFTKSPAQLYEKEAERTTFKDVAGLEGVKRDLEEVIEFLKDPKKFQRLGGRVPKGVLLMGPPGTGKTLLARAVAGEAGVPFFSISGSEFIQMFVGVGASRVRDLFKNAKEASPAILFIDEIDAVGRHRGAGMGGGNDEREQTLNQILSEMDGFEATESVIVLAATNRPDVLDPALLRPGRFDRHITVDRPTHKGRKAIFGVHVRNVPLAEDVDLERLAAGSVGLTGADIQNLVNEAALWATRHDKESVDTDDFEHARDKVLMGAKREEVLSDKEKKLTAYHEAGHALLAWILPGTDRVHKVTIIPRGRALGVTQLLPEEDRVNIGESDIRSRLIFMLGGRAAEKLIYDEFSAGAENDLSEATKLALRMVSQWGMSERLGPVSYHTSDAHPFLGKEYQSERHFSEHTAQVIDEEVGRILQDSAEKADVLLRENIDKLKILTEALVEREIINDADITELIGPSAHELSRNGSGA